MEKRIEKIESKLEKMEEVNDSQNTILAKIEKNQAVRNVIQESQHESLKEHIKASKANGVRITHVEEQAIQDRSFIKGSIWAISIAWAIFLVGVGLYFKLKG